MSNPFSLSWLDPVPDGNAPIGEVTALLASTWRRSKRRIGGDFLGTCEIKVSDDIDRQWMDDLFIHGMLMEIRENAGGEETWRGALVRMEYTRDGDVFVRDASKMSNAIRSIYTSIGDNVLTNGSGESGTWTAYPGADAHLLISQDSSWASHGAYSIKIQVTDTTIRGAIIQSGITIAAGKQYLLRATLRVTSGSWRLAVNRSDNDQSLCAYSTGGGTGDMVVDVSIPATNTYAGTVTVRITSEASAGIINVDAVVFQAGPCQAQTTWYLDSTSIAVHGRKEEVLLRGGKSVADANAECQTLLLDRAWPNPMPPSNSQTWLKQTREDTLRLTFAGYWAMLNWIYTTLHGTRTCSAWVSALAALQSTYVAEGIIDTNGTDFFIDDRGPLKVGDLLREIAEAGDSNGAKYAVGVDGKKLNYELVPPELSYYRQNGKLYSVATGEIEPWLARPGWALWLDMPVGPGTLTSNPQHDPRWVYLEEVEMLPGGNELAFKLT